MLRLGLVYVAVSKTGAEILHGGRAILRELYDLGFDAAAVRSYGCFCQFANRPDRLPQGIYHKLLFKK